MPSFHKILLDLRKKMGYKYEALGVCALYEEKAIDAFLIGEYSIFTQRCAFIEKNYMHYPALLQKAKDNIIKQARLVEKKIAPQLSLNKLYTDYQILFDIAAFIDQGELYHHSIEYKDVFARPLRQHQSQEISKYAQSYKLEKAGGRVCLASFIGIYSSSEIKKYAHLLGQLATAAKSDFALSLGGDNHAAALCYSYDKKCWLFIDVNQPSLPSITNENLEIELPDILKKAFNEIDAIPLHTQLFTTGEKNGAFQTVDDASGKTMILPEIRALSEVQNDITNDDASRTSQRGVNLAWFAAKLGDTNTLKKIIELNLPEVLNQPNSMGITPLFVAAYANQVATFRMLAEAVTPNNEPLVNLNQLGVDNRTPAFLAAQKGYCELLKVLTEAYAHGGEQVVDFNQLSGNGATPIFIAAESNQAATVRQLIEIKTPDGKQHVDINKPRYDGAAPIHVAAYNGNADILSLLIEAGADLQCLFQGKSPLELAQHNGNKHASDLIKKALESSQEQAPNQLLDIAPRWRSLIASKRQHEYANKEPDVDEPNNSPLKKGT